MQGLGCGCPVWASVKHWEPQKEQRQLELSAGAASGTAGAGELLGALGRASNACRELRAGPWATAAAQWACTHSMPGSCSACTQSTALNPNGKLVINTNVFFLSFLKHKSWSNLSKFLTMADVLPQPAQEQSFHLQKSRVCISEVTGKTMKSQGT